MFKKGVLCLLFFVTTQVTIPLYGQFDNSGTSVANFLKIGVGARGQALGGAFTALVDDATALYWNPAGIARTQDYQAVFSHTNWIFDLDLTFVGLTIPFESYGTLGFSLNALTMGEVDITTPEDPDGTSGLTYDAGDLALGATYAKKITDRFYFGFTGKYVREQVANSSASAFAIDIGTQYVTDFSGLIIGMSIKNFGTKMRLMGREQLIFVDIDPDLGSNPAVTGRLDTKAWPLPLQFNIGTSMKLYTNENMTVTGIFDYNDPRDQNPLYVFGGEWSFSDVIYLRGGYGFRQFGVNYEEIENSRSEDTFTLGAGVLTAVPISNFSIMIDYAYSDLGILNSVQWLTTTLIF